jgi:Fe-S cluster assembly scaffold protein SufB
MNVIYENEFFYIQQRGLAENTPYSFMVVNAYGEVLKPFLKPTLPEILN